MKMKVFLAVVALAAVGVVAMLTGCQAAKGSGESSGTASAYRQVTPQEAQALMGSEDNYVIVDVRRPDEYAAGHVPGAINIPNESIDTDRPAELPDLDQLILVYCRSGRRSKQASQKLADMGYTNIVEFGGINSWPGEVTTTS